MARTKKPPTRPTTDETVRTPSETTDCDRLVLGTWKGDAGLEKTSHSIYALTSDKDDDASQYAALEYDASEDDPDYRLCERSCSQVLPLQMYSSLLAAPS